MTPISHQPPNFGIVVPGQLYRGGQPTTQHLPYLQSLGVNRIISLRQTDTDERDLDVAGMLTPGSHDTTIVPYGIPLRFYDIPCNCIDIPTRQVATVLHLIQRSGVTYLHCSLGRDRTGFMVAAYRMVVQGWSFKMADAERRQYGETRLLENTILLPLKLELANLDVKAVKSLMVMGDLM